MNKRQARKVLGVEALEDETGPLLFFLEFFIF